MADLNIRNVDETLLAQLKSEAALLGFNLKSYVVGLLILRVKPQEVAHGRSVAKPTRPTLPEISDTAQPAVSTTDAH